MTVTHAYAAGQEGNNEQQQKESLSVVGCEGLM